MARRARRILAVHFHLLRAASSSCRRPIRRGAARRRRGRRRGVQQVLEHPLAAQHRRGARRVRRHGEHAGLHQHAFARRVVQIDSPELRTSDTRHAVVAREPFVDERVLRVEEVEDAAVFANDRRRRRARSPCASTGGGSPRSRGTCRRRARTDSSARVCSHCPPNCSTSACGFRIAQHARRPAPRRTAGVRSWCARRAAAARRPACWPRGSTTAASPARSRTRLRRSGRRRRVLSRRNRKSGETSTPCSATRDALLERLRRAGARPRRASDTARLPATSPAGGTRASPGSRRCCCGQSGHVMARRMAADEDASPRLGRRAEVTCLYGPVELEVATRARCWPAACPCAPRRSACAAFSIRSGVASGRGLNSAAVDSARVDGFGPVVAREAALVEMRDRDGDPVRARRQVRRGTRRPCRGSPAGRRKRTPASRDRATSISTDAPSIHSVSSNRLRSGRTRAAGDRVIT